MSAAEEKLRFLLDLQEKLCGSIPFGRWMTEALYHEKFGYYTTGIRDIGRRGDFTTWPVLHDSLARAIATWAKSRQPSRRWRIIEAGAGTGALAAAVCKALGWWDRPEYHIVEISPILKARQQKLLGRRAIWHSRMEDAIAACNGEAVIFSNELVDAFPARIFQKKDGAWPEIALRIDGRNIFEIPRIVPLPDSTIFTHDWPEGQRVEVQDSFAEWLQGWMPLWKKGAMLVIDYGDLCPALYHRRPKGSLRAYSHHQRMEGTSAYGGFGVRDLTVDVNFSDLLKWFGGGDFSTLGNFLKTHLPPAKLESLHQMLDAPDGAADAFKVVEVEKGVEG